MIMIKYLRDHIDAINVLLKAGNKSVDFDVVRDLHIAKIAYFQHERLIHLLITLFFGSVFVFLTVANQFIEVPGILFIEPVLLILLVAYVWHYYRLENGVQTLYRLDDEILKKLNGKK